MIDIAELFNITLPQALADHPEKVKEIKGTFQINILPGKGGNDGGSWFIDPVSNPPTCTPGTSKADATLTISATDFQQLAANPKKHAMSFYLFGKLKVEGSTTLAMASATKLGELFGGK